MFIFLLSQFVSLAVDLIPDQQAHNFGIEIVLDFPLPPSRKFWKSAGDEIVCQFGEDYDAKLEEGSSFELGDGQ